MADPVLLDIPEAFETERLLIRVPRAGEGPGINEAVLETFEQLKVWMPWAKERPSIEQSEEYSRKAYSLFLSRQDFTLRLIHLESGLFLGSAGLHPRDWSVPKFEIGYWCRTRFQRQGYTTEAVRGLARFGFDVMKAKRIEIYCDSENVPSARVAQRVGMKLEGELRNNIITNDGKIHNTLIFAFTDEDWRSVSQSFPPIQVVR